LKYILCSNTCPSQHLLNHPQTHKERSTQHRSTQHLIICPTMAYAVSIPRAVIRQPAPPIRRSPGVERRIARAARKQQFTSPRKVLLRNHLRSLERKMKLDEAVGEFPEGNKNNAHEWPRPGLDVTCKTENDDSTFSNNCLATPSSIEKKLAIRSKPAQSPRLILRCNKPQSPKLILRLNTLRPPRLSLRRNEPQLPKLSLRLNATRPQRLILRCNTTKPPRLTLRFNAAQSQRHNFQHNDLDHRKLTLRFTEEQWLRATANSSLTQ
jgi:hypothetical protein